MQKYLVRPQFATGFQKAPFGRRTSEAQYLQNLATQKLLIWCTARRERKALFDNNLTLLVIEKLTQ